MRLLEFNVNKQRLTMKADCDFSGIVAGSKGYLKAKFYFSEEWDPCTNKVVSFWNEHDEHALFLDKDDSCVIPHEALTSGKFYVSVIGVGSAYRINTNRTRIKQEVNRHGNC